MKDFFKRKNNKFLIIVLSVVLVLAIMVATGNTWVSSAVSLLTGGLNKTASKIEKSISAKTYDELVEENKQYQKEIADLRAQLVDYYDAKDENARLWQYYGIKKENPDYELVPATVISRNSARDFYSFSLDVGTTDGVSLQDVVITANGLIGYISYVDAYSSKVTTVLSPDIQVGAICKKTKDTGIVNGNAKYGDKNQTLLTKIDLSGELEEGDIVTTSGLGGVYPDGLIIGEVKKIDFDTYDTTKYAVIEPYDDIATVTDVAVITSFESKGE